MYVFSNIAEAEVEYLVLKVVHKDPATFGDRVIGVAPVDIQTAMNSPNITHDAWHELRKTSEVMLPGAEDVSGEVRVSLLVLAPHGPLTLCPCYGRKTGARETLSPLATTEHDPNARFLHSNARVCRFTSS